MPIGLVAAGVGAAGAIGGALISSNAATDAANIQAQGAKDANALNTKIYNETTARNAPYYNTGTSALDSLATLYGLNGKTQSFDAFKTSPDYQFRFDQGIKGIDAGATARGTLDSGATRKAELAYAGNLASGEFNNYASRLMDLARVGQSSANNQTTAGQNYANAYGTNVTNAAQAAGNASLAQGSIWGNTIGGLAGQFASSYGGGGGYSPGAPGYGGGGGGFGSWGNDVRLPGQSSGPSMGWT
jgi:hypothetical protein